MTSEGLAPGGKRVLGQVLGETTAHSSCWVQGFGLEY